MKIAFRAAGFAIGLVMISAASTAAAQDASPWQKDAHSALRLLAGSRTGAAMLGGIAISIQPGWHTYWRNPGDSGVPPRFDFSKSDNVDAVTVLWPAPKPFDDGAGGQSLGYEKHVVLPLRIAAKNPDKPVTLRAVINYAVCEKICVPVEAETEIAFGGAASLQDIALLAALQTVPTPARLGDDRPLTIRAVERAGKTVLVDVAAPDGGDVSLFVEGPTSDWSLPVPKQLPTGPAAGRRFAFDLEGLPPGVRPEGATLKLTLVGTDHAYEFDVKLD